MFDRLVGRPILAQADRIVGHDVDDADLLQRGKPDGRAGIIGEDQERAAIGDYPAVERHAVHRRGHAELANAVINVASGIILFCQRLLAFCFGVVRAGKIGRAPDRVGQ